MSRKIKEVKVIPADPSPESIKDVISVSNVVGSSFSGAKTEVCRLDGTVEEKLQQYREFFGKEWPGKSEQTYTIYEDADTSNRKPIFGVRKAELIPKHPIDIAVQATINALTKVAQGYLDDNEVAKEAWRALPEEEKMAIIAQRELENEEVVALIEAEV